MSKQTLTIHFAKTPGKGHGTAIVLTDGKTAFGPAGQELDRQSGRFLTHALKTQDKFTGKLGETLNIVLPAKAPFARAVLLGLGALKELDAVKAETAGGKLCLALEAAGIGKAALLADSFKDLKALSGVDLAAHLLTGLRLRAYKFGKYQTAKKGEKKPAAMDIACISEQHAKIATAFDRQDAALQGVYLARDLANEPPNVITPERFAAIARDTLKPLGVAVDILDEKKMKALGMEALLAVGVGSDNPPRLVVLEWNGLKGKKTGKPLALVGKGVTFDSGGISIKPAAGMEEMKMDMSGGAVVLGTLLALARRKARTHVVGVIPLAENMISGRASRPSDIVTSYAGKTVEILNTDAEGRLILADALTYVQKKYKPHTIIDLATLTGAIIVALGHEYCGAFANDDKLWDGLARASARTGEKLWRMPLDEAWRKEMEGSVTDLQNIAKSGRDAGSCTAAGFLEHFIEPGMRWAHLDIAGVAWTKAERPTVPKYASGFGVRLLDQYIADTYE